MTTLYEEKVKCCVCGAKNKFTGIGSTNTFGLSDLDTRPAEMQRSTMFAWVQRCPKCGYCSSNIGLPLEGAKAAVRRIEYKEQLEDSTYSDLANSFLCKAMIDHESKDYSAATWALIHASWVCDDADHASQATLCRKKAADMFAIAEEQGQQVSKQEGANTAILVDLLRRSGQFEQARQVIKKRRCSISGDIIARVLDFEIALIDKQDLSCHNIGEAVEENEDAIIDGSHKSESTSEEARPFFSEKICPTQTEYNKDVIESSKLMADIDFILRDYEKQFKKECNDWYENIYKKPDYKYDEREQFYYRSMSSPLSMTLKNILYYLLESERGTHCKAEDLLDSLYDGQPELLWPNKFNYIPSGIDQFCYPELLAWCFDEDDLDSLFQELIDHIERCHEQCKTVFFLTTQRDAGVYSIYADKIKAFKKVGVHFTFILFTLLRADEISIMQTTFIKRNILGLHRILARFWFSLKSRIL